MFRIKDTCAGCHNCALECPMGAIHYGWIKYEIDPEKCVECGLCEKLCPTCSIYDDARIETVEPHDLIERDCDLVVCGGGTGLVTAIRAAQLGLKVILLEKAARVGGNTNYAHGFFPIYTVLHKENGVDDVREQAIVDLCARTNHSVSEDVMRTCVYGCGEFFDWLYEFPGAGKAFNITLFGESRAMGPIYGPAVVGFPNRLDENLLSRDPSFGPGWSGTWIKNAMLKAIPEQKLDVEILTKHAAKHLVTDESGKVIGVIADDPGGRTKINARAVVLATGGFGRSDEKLQKYFGFFDVERPVSRFSVPSDTGDGIDMLQELGVEPDVAQMNVSLFGPAHHPYSYCLYRIHESAKAMNVNLNGQRWENEEDNFFMGRFHIGGNPKEVSWGIFTDEVLDEVAHEYINDPTLAEEKHIYELYRQDLEEELNYEKPPVYKADTIRELAEKIGIDPDALEDTLARYNEFCRKGKDEEFEKNPKFLRPLEKGPFWAIYGQRFSEGAFGGLRVDGQCRVCREDGSYIPGLYGVGDATSAVQRQGELAVVSELTWATASAFRSAENAAREMGVTV